MFSSDQYIQSQKEANKHNEADLRDTKKEKKIKKRKNKRNYSRVTQTSEKIDNLEAFILSNGCSYFSLSKSEATDRFCYNFKTNLHIKNIIGKDPNVYNLKKNQNSQDALHYLHLIKNRHKGRVSKVLLSIQNTKKALIFINICSRQNRKLVLLDNEEANLLSKRSQMQQEMQYFFSQNLSNSQGGMQLDCCTKELLTLCKINSIQQHEIVQKIYNYAITSSDLLHNVHEYQYELYKDLQEKYLQFLVRKNMCKGLEQTPIDMLNYFSRIDSEQKSLYDDTSLRVCKNLEQFKFYLKVKKPRQGKNADDSLKTCCSACFSNHYEIMNPIETCAQCSMRMHRLCQSIRSKCQRCKYIRKTIEEKSNIPYCLICQRQKQQNISIQFIYDGQKQYYAHTFCLLTTGSWSIRNKQICYEMPKSKSFSEKCKICNKNSNFCINCKCCDSKVHGLCAFLEGYSLKISDQNNLIVDYCQDQGNNKKLSLTRKFKMNYEKILYKNNEEIFKMIQ